MTTPAAQLKTLVKKRSAIKSSVNSISKYVKKFNKTQSIRQLQIRLTSLNQYIIDFNNIQQAIQDLDIGEEEEDERLTFEENNYTLVAEMEDLIAEANSIQIQNNSHTSNSSNGESLRLPMIQPPTFNGSLEDWASFFDTFNALFHNNSQLNDVQRLHYLK